MRECRKENIPSLHQFEFQKGLEFFFSRVFSRISEVFRNEFYLGRRVDCRGDAGGNPRYGLFPGCPGEVRGGEGDREERQDHVGRR